MQADDRTGGWTTEVGGAKSRGPLDIAIVCVGGGRITVRYGQAFPLRNSFTVACDGTTQGIYDEAAPVGPVRVAVHPDGIQHWSTRVGRGPRG